MAQARKAMKIWAKSSFKQRRQFLRILLKYIIEHQELICEYGFCSLYGEFFFNIISLFLRLKALYSAFFFHVFSIFCL